MIVILLIITFFGLIGWLLIGNLDNEVKFDQYKSNFSDMGTTMNILYGLISFDNYPDCMIPSVTYSGYFYIYFLIYTTIQILFFIPIPTAVVFEAFR